MNRRGFLRAVGIGVGALVAAAKLPAALFASEPPTRLFDGPLTFRGIPVVYDPHCPSNRVYFLSHNGPMVLNADGWRNLSVDA